MWRQRPKVQVQWKSLEDSVERGYIVKPRITDTFRISCLLVQVLL